MTSHTPGPWTVHECSIFAGPNRIGKALSPDFDDLIPTPQNRANSRLMAAAPQLLEALAWALSQISDDLDLDQQEALDSAHGLVMRFEESR